MANKGANKAKIAKITNKGSRCVYIDRETEGDQGEKVKFGIHFLHYLEGIPLPWRKYGTLFLTICAALAHLISSGLTQKDVILVHYNVC